MSNSVKYHISEDGNPRRCRATKNPCPIGGSAVHYSSKEEAREAYEVTQQALSMMEVEHKSVSQADTTIPEDPMISETRPPAEYEGMSIREIHEMIDEDEQERALHEEEIGERMAEWRAAIRLN